YSIGSEIDFLDPRSSPHMAVRGRLEKHWLGQFIGLYYIFGFQPKYRFDHISQISVGHVELGSTVGIYIKADRFRYSYGVGYLDQNPIRYSSCHKISGDVTAGVRC